MAVVKRRGSAGEAISSSRTTARKLLTSASHLLRPADPVRWVGVGVGWSEATSNEWACGTLGGGWEGGRELLAEGEASLYKPETMSAVSSQSELTHKSTSSLQEQLWVSFEQLWVRTTWVGSWPLPLCVKLPVSRPIALLALRRLKPASHQLVLRHQRSR